MKIYNTLTGKKEELKEKKIGIYVCGPTVYDEPHIGHARSAYVFDVIVKYLRFKKLKIKFVRNITDIDDKIIDRALRETGNKELKDKVKEVAVNYLKRYHEDMDLIGLARPDIEPRATETIPDMVKFITLLIKKGFGYETNGNVYFDVRKFKNYGRLSHQSLDEMEEGARVTLDKNKKDPLDFALWKKSKEDEPSWKSPWGEGRPGWHIECSVMSTKFLGNNFLIHGGGLDLIFPHHENEIAQTVSAGKKSPKYWLHNGLLTIGNEKMSKSLGNFVTIRDFLREHKDPDLLKLLFLSSHYKHPVDYTEEKIVEMAKMKERITIFFQKVEEAERTGNRKPVSKKQKSSIDKVEDEFINAMDDDFNTPKALAAIFELVTLGNTCLVQNNLNLAKNIKKLVKKLCSVLGISLEKAVRVEPELEKKVERLIKERNAARRDKDFKKADEIRKELLEKDIVLEDGKEGTLWRRKL